MLTVNIRERDGGDRRLVFGTEEVTIGRSKGSDILLPKNNISKRHARLVDRDDKVVLVDLRSTNGTYVNGRRITAPEVVGPKDKIYIGDFVLKVEAVKSPEHEHTMPQEPVSETAMMDPAPLDDADIQLPSSPTEGDAPAEAAAIAADEEIEPLELGDYDEDEDEDEEVAQGPTTDPGRAGPADEEPSISAEDVFDDDFMESTAALDLEEMGITPDEAEQMGQAPTQHRGMTEDFASVSPDEAEPAEEEPAEEEPAEEEPAEEEAAEEEPEEEAAEEEPEEEAAEEEPEEEAAEEEAAEEEAAEEEAAEEEAAEEEPAEEEPAEEEEDDDEPVEEFEFELEDDDAPVETAEALVETEKAPAVTESTAEIAASVAKAAAKESPVVNVPDLTAEAIDAMLGDVTVDGILINSHDSVVVRRGHAATVIPGNFESTAALEKVANALAKRAGFDGVGEQMLDGVLEGGISLNIIPPPLAPAGPVVILRRASANTATAAALSSSNEQAATVLREAVAERRNILIVSDQSATRTTALNALAHFIPEGERLAVVEDSQEITVPHRNVMRLDKGALADAGESFLDVVPQLLVDRVLIDPVSAEDVIEFIGLALDGHDGMMVTARGRSANGVLRRMSLAIELAIGASLDERARDMVAEAVDLVVVVDRAEGGVVVREIVRVDDAGEFGFRTNEILAKS